MGLSDSRFSPFFTCDRISMQHAYQIPAVRQGSNQQTQLLSPEG
jgi:hypothetical protein